MVERESGSVQPVVEAQPAATSGALRPLDQPFLELLVATGTGDRQCVEHAGRAPGQTQTARAELLYVAGEETIIPFGCGAGDDGPDDVVAQAAPSRGIRVDARVRSYRRLGRHDRCHSLIEERRRDREVFGDDGGVVPRLLPG